MYGWNSWYLLMYKQIRKKCEYLPINFELMLRYRKIYHSRINNHDAKENITFTFDNKFLWLYLFCIKFKSNIHNYFFQKLNKLSIRKPQNINLHNIKEFTASSWIFDLLSFLIANFISNSTASTWQYLWYILNNVWYWYRIQKSPLGVFMKEF